MQLQTKDQLMMGTAGITKIAYDFRKGLGLHNCAVADKGSIMMDNAGIKKIADNFRRDRRTA